MKLRRCLIIGTLAFGVWGCEPDSHATPTIDRGAIKTQSGAPDRPVAPVPKTADEVAALGIPVYPGSVIAEEADAATLTDQSFSRIYKVKMYAPAEYAIVLGTYTKGIKNSKLGGAQDFQKVKGETEKGDDIEVMLGPAADHKKTLVMAWLTQKK